MTHPQAPARPDEPRAPEIPDDDEIDDDVVRRPREIPEHVWQAARTHWQCNPADEPGYRQPEANVGQQRLLITSRAIMAERALVEAEWTAKLSDPNAVHAMMLRGTIAKPSISQIVHLYGGEVTRAYFRAGA